MAGGTWKAQNKRRPGVYINVKGSGKPVTTSPVGRLLMFQNKPLGWGENGVITLDATSDFEAKTGHKLNDSELTPVKEALKNAETVLLVNSTTGSKKASAEILGKDYIITAKYAGVVGNKISINLINETNSGKIQTLVGTKIVDEVELDTNNPLLEIHNDWVDSQFSEAMKILLKSAEIARNEGNDARVAYINKLENEMKAKVTELASQMNEKLAIGEHNFQLEGGQDGTSNITDVMNEALENEYYAVATTAGWEEDSNIHQLFAEQIKRLRENIGLKVRGVVPNSKDVAYNYEGISGVKNGYKLNDGTVVDVPTATARFAGMSASANAGTALTYADIDDAIEAAPRLNNAETIDALDKGEIVFTTRPGQRVVVEQDIDTLTKWSGEKPKEFSKNRIIRTLDDISTNTQQVFESSYLGKVGNDDAGRNLFKADRTSYLQGLQSQSIIQNFKPEDLEVLPGEDSDAVVMNLSVQPVDAMEKLYVTITVR